MGKYMTGQGPSPEKISKHAHVHKTACKIKQLVGFDPEKEKTSINPLNNKSVK